MSRRVPPDVGQAWDAWLTDFTVTVRAAAGAAWPDAWLTAPLWHFALGRGVAGGSGQAGVLMASVDRVGRMYPFTIIGPADGVPPAAWSDRVEALILDALEDSFDPAALEAALTRLGPPRATTPIGAGRTEWWSSGSDSVAAQRLVLPSLPARDVCVAMVLGADGAVDQLA